MKQFTSVFALICAFSSSAHAFWDVQKSEKDVFGNVNVTATSYGDNGNTIRFECGSSSVPYFVFLIRNSSKVIDRPARFLHKDQNGNLHESDATLTSWNEKFVAVKVTDVPMMRRVAEHMLVASKSIPVGISLPDSDFKISDTFSPRGSTAAAKIVVEHCLSD